MERAPLTQHFVLASDHHVVELHEHLTPAGLALELHVVRCAGGQLWAAWVLEDGRGLGVVEVGEA